MKRQDVRVGLKLIQKIHEDLGEVYLDLCDQSGIEPMPVVWQTFPPCPEGETSAYVINEYEDMSAPYAQPGFDVHADNRAELAHLVYSRVFALRCVNTRI